MILKTRLAAARVRLASKKKRDRALHKRIARNENVITGLKKKVVAASQPPLRIRAYNEAVKMIGVMEQGGNNRGARVEEIIHANGGSTGEPWCGDFQAWCYRRAGSTCVQRAWASVSLLGAVSGVVRTTKPLQGDLVRYTFDHVGMFVKDNGNGTITTIEGNTGASGAVSDSKTGGDGVYKKIRSKSLVKDYLQVTR